MLAQLELSGRAAANSPIAGLARSQFLSPVSGSQKTDGTRFAPPSTPTQKRPRLDFTPEVLRQNPGDEACGKKSVEKSSACHGHDSCDHADPRLRRWRYQAAPASAQSALRLIPRGVRLSRPISATFNKDIHPLSIRKDTFFVDGAARWLRSRASQGNFQMAAHAAAA